MSDASEQRREVGFEQITPFFHVADLDASIDFFVCKLGFRASVHTREYAYVHRGTIGVRLLLRGDSAEYLKANAPPVQRRYAYIDVHDVDGLHAELRPKLTNELSSNPDEPRDQPYGQREFTVFGPEGIVLFFGQMIVGS